MKKTEKYLTEFKDVSQEWFTQNDWLEPRYKFFKKFFSPVNIEKAVWKDFQEMGENLHCFNSLAIAKKNALGKPNLPIKKYRDIFKYIATSKDSVDIIINNTINKKNDRFYLPYFGESAISELIAYSRPGQFVIYNKRSIEALSFLGINAGFKWGDKFGEKFVKYNEALRPVLESYNKIVGLKTKTSLHIELDQFFSWLYSTHTKQNPVDSFSPVLKKFLDQAKTDNLARQGYPDEFKGLKVKVSFGVGNKSRVPWIAFLKDSNEVTNGIYPAYYYYKNENILFLVYGVSTTNKPTKQWPDYQSLQSIEKWFAENTDSTPPLFSTSYVKVDYNLTKKLDPKNMDLDLHDILEEYSSIDFDTHNDNDLNESIKYWLYAPGTNAKYWKEFFEAGIMAIGWDKLGDLNQYSAKEEIISKLQEIEDTKASKKNDATANHEFKEIIKKGDIVIAKKGKKRYIGYGIVTSDYYYDPSRSYFNKCRRVDWKKEGDWIDKKGDIVTKTLTDITKYPEYVERLKSLIGIETGQKPRLFEELPLNLILYGPPGTGKTYNTVNEALMIINPEFYYANQGIENRKTIREEFNKLLIKDWVDPKGQIAFCTFHQSFSYEDFVEGIKPKTSEGKISYDIEDGVFKRMCDLADSNYSTINVIKEGMLLWSRDDFQNATFYKVSLGDVTKPADREIYEYCRDNNYITIGSNINIDYSGYSESEIFEKCNQEGLTRAEALQLNYFIHSLKVGDYVLVSHGNRYLRALGRVTGEYEYNENPPIRYNHFRSVEWIFVDKKIPVEEVYDRPFTQNTLYKIDIQGLKEDFFTGRDRKEKVEQKEDKRYVLIIDEINRGNIANIFGELITLIEKDKRASHSEELEVVLPYSKETLKVPPNLFIIGTMNTADRSIEALDTALRRRFSFREIAPEPDLIKTTGVLKPTGLIISYEDDIEIDVVRLLSKINDRIEKLIDKDHMIGHSYFMNILTFADLKTVFKDKVVPLLQEYFFGDFGKIGLIIGNSFVERVNYKDFGFASFDGYNHESGIVQDLADRPIYRIKCPSTAKASDFVAIYSNKTESSDAS